MTRYMLELAGKTLALSAPRSDQIILERLALTLNAGSRLSFTARNLNLAGSVGLFSSVKLWVDDTLIFCGRVIAERTFSSSREKGKRLEAGGPIDLARSVIACDAGGVPKLQYAGTTVGDVLLDLFERHGDQLRQAGSISSSAFYETSQLESLTEPVDQFWLENRDLSSAVRELLEFGPYALTIDPEDLFWRVRRFDELDEFPLALWSSSSEWSLINYVIDRRFENSYSAVRLVSDRQVEPAYASAPPAWDSDLESDWQLRHAFYIAPGADEPDDLAWVYRRFSYAELSDLLEDHPVELVQKVKRADGNWTYASIDTLPIDRTGKYVLARYPVLATPGESHINIRNGLISGKSQGGDVYIRYRRFTDQPRLCQRYPSDGHAGWALEIGGAARELVVYSPDDRLINTGRARRLWRQVNKADQRINLVVAGPLPAELVSSPRRIRLQGADDLELFESEALLAERIDYDFGTNRLQMELKRLR
jgi:hypothetical protein